jgi:hypothetical protein
MGYGALVLSLLGSIFLHRPFHLKQWLSFQCVWVNGVISVQNDEEEKNDQASSKDGKSPSPDITDVVSVERILFLLGISWFTHIVSAACSGTKVVKINVQAVNNSND